MFRKCIFMLINNKFYIKDNDARDGTLVKAGKEVQLNMDRKVKLQVGKAVYEFKYE